MSWGDFAVGENNKITLLLSGNLSIIVQKDVRHFKVMQNTLLVSFNFFPLWNVLEVILRKELNIGSGKWACWLSFLI